MNLADEIAHLTALCRADTQAALTSIAESRAIAARLGISLPETAVDARHQRGPKVSASKGKSKPNLAGWLRRALPDGSLPVPNDHLIVSARMIQQGLAGGYIIGEQHPYRITPAGRVFATADFKGRLIARE